MKFYITAVRPGESGVAYFLYDNTDSSLLREDGSPVAIVKPAACAEATVVSQECPGIKQGVRVLKISLGLQCNYECSYCSQRFVPRADATNPGDVDAFMQKVLAAEISPERIEFWGGEPFVYWKTLRPLAEALRQRFPAVRFNIITNGSLLDAEKNEWLDRMGFSVGISHDGPGYSARGIDPLDVPKQRDAIMDLYGRLHPQGRISINAVLHSDNQSRAAIQVWLQGRFGEDVKIGEGSFIDPYDEGGAASSLKTRTEHIEYRRRAFAELRTGMASNFNVAASKIMDFVESIQTARPAKSLGQKCGSDKPDSLSVDLNGNVITCQNVSAAGTAPNGHPHKLGTLNDLAGVELKTSTHWSKRSACASCPVLQLCKGSCMFLQGPLWDTACDTAYSDNIPFFAAAIEYLTGYAPIFINGEFREDRKDIFGQLRASPEKPAKRVIPIAVSA